MKMKKPSSKKTRKLDITITVALIALVGTLATALFNSPVILELLRNKPTPTAPTQSIVDSSNPLPVGSVAPLSGGNADCLTQHFANIEPAMQMSIEVGVTAQDYYLSSDDLSNKDFIGPIGIRLTQNGSMIAALSFIFFPDSQLFKITSVVDANCEAVTEYENAVRGGDPNAIENSDTLKLQLAGNLFSINFQFSGTNFIRFSFQQLQ
jgi:hypothetical protein